MSGEPDSAHVDKEVLPFLSKKARLDVRSIAMQYFLGLTGSEEGCRFIMGNKKYLSAVMDLTTDTEPTIAKDAYLALVNLTTSGVAAYKLVTLDEHPHFIASLFKTVLNSESHHADIVCALLSNITRVDNCAKKVVKIIKENQAEIGFDKLIQTFCKKDFNKNAKLHYLGQVLSNLTMIQDTRQYILDKDQCVIQRLLPFTEYKESPIRRGGIVGTLRNCCFETEYHCWLLGPQVDILPALLLPLAGPEEFDEEDNERLPPDLQWLEPDKARETDPDIRIMLVEAIMRLCVTPECRKIIKDNNTYVIMRELHQWEKDPAAKAAEENFIHLLIGDEPEAGMENLEKVDIPPDVEKKLEEADAQLQKDIEEETKKLILESKSDAQSSS